MSEFVQAQKGMMTFVIPLAWITGYVMWRISKRETHGEETEYDRWGVWYWVVAGAIGAKWLFHALPNSTLHTSVGSEAYPSYGILSFGVFLGLVIMVMLQEVGRGWHENPNYTASPYVEAQEEMLNKDTMTRNNNLSIGNLNEFGAQLFTGYDKTKDQDRRTRNTVILLICMFYLAGIEGLFTCYWQDKSPAGIWVLVLMSSVLRLLDSLIVYGAMIHGLFYADERDHWCELIWSYGAISLYWCTTLLLSLVPIFIDMPPRYAKNIISRWPFALATGVCAGVLIWFWAYFMFMQPRSIHKRYIKWRLIAFVVTGGISGVTSLFV